MLTYLAMEAHPLHDDIPARFWSSKEELTGASQEVSYTSAKANNRGVWIKSESGLGILEYNWRDSRGMVELVIPFCNHQSPARSCLKGRFLRWEHSRQACPAPV